MKVLVGPRAEARLDGAGMDVSRALAGPEGTVVSLAGAGVGTLCRTLSAAEVSLIRGALGGRDPIVGYVCQGTCLEATGATVAGGAVDGEVRVVAVADHVNLTWRSPLAGPNDEKIGPRFPSMTGIYAPETVVDRIGAAGGMIVTSGVVAGVHDEGHLSPFEAGVVSDPGCAAVSSELVPVVILAAHLGLRVAAALVTAGSEQEETSSGRS
jgi:hypothetical protein